MDKVLSLPVVVPPASLANRLPVDLLPAARRRAGEQASRRFAEFFARIVNPHTCASNDVLQMVKRRARGAGLPAERVCYHTFRATGITAYMENGGRLEHAQRIAAHDDQTLRPHRWQHPPG